MSTRGKAVSSPRWMQTVMQHAAEVLARNPEMQTAVLYSRLKYEGCLPPQLGREDFWPIARAVRRRVRESARARTQIGRSKLHVAPAAASAGTERSERPNARSSRDPSSHNVVAPPAGEVRASLFAFAERFSMASTPADMVRVIASIDEIVEELFRPPIVKGGSR